MIGLDWYQHSFDFPLASEPEWAAKVERWYQLDAGSFALTETFWRHQQSLEILPKWMLLASPLASNVTDRQFVASGASSPAKFVHTLPNIRSASLLQVMGWTGPVLCLQNDPKTVLTGISEGMGLALSTKRPVWVLSVTGAGVNFTGSIFVLDSNTTASRWKISKSTAPEMAIAASHDKDLFLWLNGSEQAEHSFTALECEIVKAHK